MKILIRQFLGANHSWGVIGREMARALLKKQHDVKLYSTDGIDHLPRDLMPYLIGYSDGNPSGKMYGNQPGPNYDACISYTCMKNFSRYLSHSKKNRFGIWSYEWAGVNALPTGFAQQHVYCDTLLPPSESSMETFANSGVPKNKMQVLSHGINGAQFGQATTISLPTKKKFKILSNIAQNHKRKNISGLLTAYGKAFTIDDDVCLLLKARPKRAVQTFDIDLNEYLNSFYKQFPKHAEVKLITNYIDDISVLYRSIDAVFTMSHTECFYIPGLEGLASGKVNICPNYGGQKDFLTTDNSLLIEGDEVEAEPTSMYWEQKRGTKWFMPNMESAIEQLRKAYSDFSLLNAELEKQRMNICDHYDWSKIVDQIPFE
jgi:glycosyltransferase involved in cell wall biosynthesis